MKEVLPIIIGCSAGIVACVVYLIFLLVRGLRVGKPRKMETFDFDENTLTIDIKNSKK